MIYASIYKFWSKTYQKALIQNSPQIFTTKFHLRFLLRYNLCEFTTREHNFKMCFCTENPVWKVRFKDFWYTKINLCLVSKFWIVITLISKSCPSSFFVSLKSALKDQVCLKANFTIGFVVDGWGYFLF